MSGGNQCWQTPQDLFDALDREVGGFDIDVAADKDNAKCKEFMNKEDSAFHNDWYWDLSLSGQRQSVWCNPPYEKPIIWVNRAIQQVSDAPNLVVYMLLNHDASTKWYAEAIEHASEIRIMTHKRVQFVAPDGVKSSSNSKAQCVIVFRKKQPSAPCHVWHWDWTKDIEGA